MNLPLRATPVSGREGQAILAHAIARSASFRRTVAKRTQEFGYPSSSTDKDDVYSPEFNDYAYADEHFNQHYRGWT